MRITDLRAVTQDRTTIWLQDDESGKCIQANEFRFIDRKYDDCKIELMFPEKYPVLGLRL